VATWISRLPAIRDILGISVAEVGFLLFGLSAGAVSGLLGAAMVVHRLGARRTMVLTFVVGSLALGLLAVSVSLLVSFPLAIAAMAIFGVAWSICDVAMNVEGTQVEREMKRTLMPWYHASWSLGTVAGAGIGALVALAGIGPAAHLAAVALAVLVTALLIPRLLPRELEPEPAEATRGRRADSARRSPRGGSPAYCSSACWCSAWRSPKVRPTTGWPSP
jgi:predicted MFS family arabinose efflux permease